SSFMPASARSISVRTLGAIATVALVAGAFAACNEATAPARRFALLDDVGESDWQSVTVGTDHTCGLKVSGAAFCWGSNRTYQLGIARVDTICGPEKSQFVCTMTPQPVQAGVKFASISAGARHTCAITR